MKDEKFANAFLGELLNEPVIHGLSADQPIKVNENGGKQSDTPYGFHQLPLSAMFAAAEVAKYGADKYGETFEKRNYTKIPSVEHLNHALQHIYAHLAEDKSDEHLSHAIIRVMFAYDTFLKERNHDKDAEV